MLTRGVLLSLLLSVSTLAAVARADPTAADLESARQLFRQGNDLRDADDLRGALAKYRAADALVSTPITSFEVGRTHVRLGELVEGYAALASVAKIPTKPKESANTASARTEAERLAREVEPRIPSLRVTPKNIPAGAALTVQIDGKKADPGALTKVNPGKHGIVVHADGVSHTAEVTIAESETREVEVVFDPIAPAKVVETQPAQVAEPSNGRPTWIYVGFAVAGAGVIVGSIAGILTLRGTSDLADRCPGGDCPPSEHDRLKSTDRWATVSTISFAVAGAAAAVSIVGLFTTSPKRAEAGTLRPTIGLGSIGLEGAF
jgi:hypothetical protein